MKAIVILFVLFICFKVDSVAQVKSEPDTVVFMYASYLSSGGIYFVTGEDSIRTSKKNLNSVLLKTKALNEPTFFKLCMEESGKKIKAKFSDPNLEIIKFYPGLKELNEARKIEKEKNSKSTLMLDRFIFKSPISKESVNQVIRN